MNRSLESLKILLLQSQVKSPELFVSSFSRMSHSQGCLIVRAEKLFVDEAFFFLS